MPQKSIFGAQTNGGNFSKDMVALHFIIKVCGLRGLIYVFYESGVVTKGVGIYFLFMHA
jgi:hypothetical protein